jgi:hypothetical protein
MNGIATQSLKGGKTSLDSLSPLASEGQGEQPLL